MSNSEQGTGGPQPGPGSESGFDRASGQQPGLTTPPFGAHTAGPQFQSGAAEQPVSPGVQAPYYTATDFPAPAGVRPLAESSAAPAALAQRPKGRLAAMLVAASLSAVIGAGAGIGGYQYASSGQGVTASPISVTTVPAAQAPALDGSISAAAEKIGPSVVTITVASGQGGGVGTGVVIDKSGHILTNNHVVEGAARGGRVNVTFQDGTTAEATVVGTSASNDLAVVKVEGVSDLTPAVFAKSESVTVGESVVAAGAPLGLSKTITSGIVSNTARPVRSGSNDDAVYLAVQTDAAINPGNSGGPLVNLNGAVVGINSSIASTGSQAGNIGIGFAIPSDVAVRVAGELIASGTSKNAAMGVTVAGSDGATSPQAGVPLETVVEGGAADRAGLQAGDVVTRINDFATTTADGLIAATRFYAAGSTVEVTYTRDGRATTVDVTLGSS